MKLELNDKTLRTILIVVGVLTILIIFLIIRSRSRYLYPETDATVTASTIYTTYQSALTACETQYARDKLNGVAEATAAATRDTCITGPTTTYIKARCPILDTANSRGTLTAAQKGLMTDYDTKNTALSTTITNIKSKYVEFFTPTGSSTSPIGSVALTATSSSMAPATGSKTFTVSGANPFAATNPVIIYAADDSTINMTGTVTTVAPFVVNVTAANGATAKTSWLITAPDKFPFATLSSSSINIDNPSIGGTRTADTDAVATAANVADYIVKKARDAEIAGATRAFMQGVCPDYFKMTSVNSGTAYDYTRYTFTPANVTAQSIVQWAKRAAVMDSSGTAVPLLKFTTGTNSNQTFTMTGGSDVDGQTNDPYASTTQAMKAWQIAKNNGPGSGVASGTAFAYPAAAV